MEPPAQQKWQFIVAWYDGSNLYIQVDDNPVDTLAYTAGVYDGNTMFLVGGDPYDGQRFDGAIDEVALYKRVLSDEERAWLYNAGLGRSYAELLGEQPPSEGWMQRGYAYEGQQPHAVTSVSHSGGADTYEYDQNGNMTCRQESGAWFVQTYNAENRIASIRELAEGDCETPVKIAMQWDYAYDGDGARTATLTTPYDENGNPQTASLTTYYFGGAYEVTDGAVKKYYALAGQTVAMRDGNGLQFFLTDHLGSVLAVTDSSGTLISEQRYLPFGQVRDDVGTITQTDFGYTFQRSLPGTGLMDYRARFYAPYLNRFTQPDSIVPEPGNPQDWNRYSYVRNNPILYIDPTGHKPCWGTSRYSCNLTNEQIWKLQHGSQDEQDFINNLILNSGRNPTVIQLGIPGEEPYLLISGNFGSAYYAGCNSYGGECTSIEIYHLTNGQADYLMDELNTHKSLLAYLVKLGLSPIEYIGGALDVSDYLASDPFEAVAAQIGEAYYKRRDIDQPGFDVGVITNLYVRRHELQPGPVWYTKAYQFSVITKPADDIYSGAVSMMSFYYPELIDMVLDASQQPYR